MGVLRAWAGLKNYVTLKRVRLTKRLKLIAARLAPPKGELVHVPEVHIDADAYYARPVMLPYMVKAAGPAAVSKFLTEAKAYYRGQFDDPYRSSLDAPVSMPVEDPLEEWDYTTRRDVLTNCHAAYHRNPVAKRAIDLTQQFAVGKGHTVTAKNKEVQAVIDAFRANPENAIQQHERTLLRDLQVDGELFIRFFSSGGEVIMVALPPWYVVEIDTDPEFFRRVRQYHVQYSNPISGEAVDRWIPAGEVLHVPINNHSYELRGRPDLYVILPWLKAYKDWLEDRYRQNKWRGALLWWVKVTGAAAGTIAAKVAQWRNPPTSGSAYVSSDREEVQALTNPAGASDVSEDGRQIRIMAAMGIGLAEYMLGDGENANLATATAQQLPTLWKFTDAQEIMSEMVWTPIYKRVITEAVNAGKLPAEVEVQDADGDPVPDVDPVPAEEAFTVEYYELQSSDPKTMVEAIALDLSNELVSLETARGMRGYDHVMEAKRLQTERETMRDEIAQGLRMAPPGMEPGGENEQDEDEQDTDKGKGVNANDEAA